MRLLLAAGASGNADLENALIDAPSLDIVGHERSDAQAIVLTAADAGSRERRREFPCAVFASAVAGTAVGYRRYKAERGSGVSVLAPAPPTAHHIACCAHRWTLGESARRAFCAVRAGRRPVLANLRAP